MTNQVTSTNSSFSLRAYKMVKWVIFDSRTFPYREQGRVFIIVTLDSYPCVLNILYSVMEGTLNYKDSFFFSPSRWFVCFLEEELVLTHSLRGWSIMVEKLRQQEIEVADHIELSVRRQNVISAVVLTL